MRSEMAATGIVCALLAIVVRALVPKMLDSENPGKQFGIGVILFLIYNAVMMLLFRYFCTFEGTGFGSGEDVFVRITLAFVIVNIMALFCACIYFFTRQKRKLTQEEKMKLKDL